MTQKNIQKEKTLTKNFTSQRLLRGWGKGNEGEGEGGGGGSHPLPKIDLVPYNTTGYIHVYYGCKSSESLSCGALWFVSQ